MSIQHPETLGNARYIVDRLLGSGGAARVYRVHDTVLDMPRAAKVLTRHHEMLQARFLTESRLLARLRHPNLVRCFDLGTEGGTSWSILELAPGGSLTQRLREEKLSIDETLDAAFQISCGLQALHDRGLVHRDVKPGNVLFGSHGRLWITDLGVVGGDLGNFRQWKTTGTLGTRGYQAPELLADPATATLAADIFGVGALLYAAFTARTPPDLSHLDLAPQLLKGFPGDLARIVRKCTRHDPKQRYSSMRDLAVDVAEAIRARGGTPHGMVAWDGVRNGGGARTPANQARGTHAGPADPESTTSGVGSTAAVSLFAMAAAWLDKVM